MLEVDRQVTPIRLAIVDNDSIVRRSLDNWLRDVDSAVTVVAVVGSWADLLSDPEFPTDVVLLDLDLQDGIPVAVKLAMLRPAGVATVMISTLSDPRHVRQSVSAGALGFLPKDADAEEILAAVKAASAGASHITPTLAKMLIADEGMASHPDLSDQEIRALTLYAAGLPMKTVARQMGVSVHTAKCYVDRVREKYAQAGREARTKFELRQRALEDNLISGQG
ncbi:response regulator [Lentzea sp. NPDC004789]